MRDNSKSFLKNFWWSIPLAVELFGTGIVLMLVTKHILPFSPTFLICTLLLCFTLVICFILLLKTNEKNIKTELSILKQEMQIIQEYYASMDAKIEEIDKLRHELRNFISLVHAEEDEKSTWTVLVNDLDRQAKAIIQKKYCENTLVNIIINKKAEQARKLDIDFSSTVMISNEINIDIYDLCSCIFNLLDNAIAANASNGANKKWISLKANTIGNYFIIKQTNSVFAETKKNHEGIYLTQKENKEEHGFGLSVMRDICKKYDGFCEFEDKDGVFYSTLGFSTNWEKITKNDK